MPDPTSQALPRRNSSAGCACSTAHRSSKPNGTCGTCGGWLPGERPAPLPWLADDLKRAGAQIKTEGPR